MTTTPNTTYRPADDNLADEALASVVSRRLVAAGFTRQKRETTRVRGYHRTTAEGFTATGHDGNAWVYVRQVNPTDIDRMVQVLVDHGYVVRVNSTDIDGRYSLTVAGRYARCLED